jgi:two-component system chemotaxis response regulator CheB
MIRVVVAEDSLAAMDLLVAILESDPEIQVVGRAANGAEAVAMAERLRPDLVTMDVHMPVMDGFEATRQIMARAPVPILVVSSLARRDDVHLSLKATQLGAVMVLPKPGGPGSPRFEEERAELVRMARAMAEVKVVRRWASTAPASTATVSGDVGTAAGVTMAPRPLVGTVPVRVMAVAASTGGPAALQQIFSALPAGFSVPILAVQHIARGFTEPMADWLNATCQLRVKVAEAGERPEPGHVYLAPDDAHLTIARNGALALSDAEPVGGFRPSASALFESVGRHYGPAAVTVILTGMGDDGIAGLRVAHAAGARVLAQDEATSIVYGMPKEAARARLVDEILPLGEIAGRLTALAG